MLEDLALRADRAMRTSSARDAAEGAYLTVRQATLRTPPAKRDGALLETLAVRRAWQRRGDREFVCAFGGRSATITIPASFDAEQLARMITRVEVSVFLGDSDPLLLRELQGVAERELQRFFDEEKDAADAN